MNLYINALRSNASVTDGAGGVIKLKVLLE
jgi:hypothetical protein